MLNGNSRSQKRTYEVKSGTGSRRERVLSFSLKLKDVIFVAGYKHAFFCTNLKNLFGKEQNQVLYLQKLCQMRG